MLKPGTYVTDRSDSGRYDKAVHCVVGAVGPDGDQTVVRYVGSVVKGRIEYARNQPTTHRTTANLQVWP